ncbi:MAG: hypothetical protein AAGE03_10725 [Pseudomonadota bacterium]
MTSEKIELDGAKATLYLEAPSWDGLGTMAIGALKAPDIETANALLDHIRQRAKALGAEALIGPMDGDTWHSYRLVTETDGRPPFLMEPTSPAHLLQAFEAAGFQTISRYFSAARPLVQGIPDASIQIWDGSDPDALFTQVHRLSCEAFADNAFYKPIDLDTFLGMYRPVIPMLKPDLVLFARDGDRLTGFLFGIPDYAEGPGTKTAILKTYASLARGVGRALAQTFHANAAASGYDMAIHALIHDDNISADRSRQEGAAIFRRYALMGLRLV